MEAGNIEINWSNLRFHKLQYTDKHNSAVLLILATVRFYYFFLLAQQPPLGQGLLIHEVSRSHTTKHHTR